MNKIGIRIGKWLNSFIKSYGTLQVGSIWVRREFVCFLCSIIAQIDEEEYFRNRNTIAWRDKNNKNFYWYNKAGK